MDLEDQPGVFPARELERDIVGQRRIVGARRPAGYEIRPDLVGVAARAGAVARVHGRVPRHVRVGGF